MLKVRIIPTLLWKKFGLVKGIGFDSWRRVGPVLPSIKVYNAREVDELFFLDITATTEGNEPDYESVEDFSSECFVPLAVGGGIRNLDQITRLLSVGADKVCINSVAHESQDLVTEAANRFGSQCVVVSIDARRMPNGDFQCFSHCGREETGMLIADWAMQMEDSGAGEILVTSIERDGTMTGYEIDMIREVTERVNVPVIASGGAGSYEHMALAIHAGGVSAVAAASMFHFTEQTPLEAKRHLAAQGIPVRDSEVDAAPFDLNSDNLKPA